MGDWREPLTMMADDLRVPQPVQFNGKTDKTDDISPAMAYSDSSESEDERVLGKNDLLF